ncbi:DmsC/YnfH family molybdoenzyme membrane anchor subunit [uncultured Tessaracoccus sp.]|uniref:dimethyl sulfoxide reductase anchor subunit family protein n=1 Tax=uncultured Tessaracoccus sp. TaxID=905023 RepID=UPI0025E0AC15|nr:DmsC/YnfH family molybdoenzyme membrane anchor subunit [uncultured Tessaracoccus sp.]
MNLHELPMILFTVLAQMSVGAFLVLGVVQTVGSLRRSSSAVDRIADPALYAIGPTLVLGLLASMLHMNDVFHVLNVFRGWQRSWLSREILFGLGFAGLGFLFALMQWRKWGSARLRQAVAGITALVGVGLLWVMSRIYTSLIAVPAWHTWFTPVQFVLTAVLLGSLAVGTAFMTTLMFQRHMLERDGRFLGAKVAPGRADAVEVGELLATSLRGIAVTVIVAGLVLLVLLPLHLTQLADAGPAGAMALEAYSGPWFVLRLVLVAVGAGLLGLFTYGMARPDAAPKPLAACITVAFALVFVAELLGRMQFYESMVRIGI